MTAIKIVNDYVVAYSSTNERIVSLSFFFEMNMRNAFFNLRPRVQIWPQGEQPRFKQQAETIIGGGVLEELGAGHCLQLRVALVQERLDKMGRAAREHS